MRETHNVEMLGAAIVAQTIKDYKKALKMFDKAKRMIKDCEEFFQSQEFELYNTTKLSGKEVIDEIQSQLYEKKDKKEKIA